MLKVICTISSSLSDKKDKRIVVESIGNKETKSESVIIKTEVYESNEWRVQDTLVVDGGELIAAVQRSRYC